MDKKPSQPERLSFRDHYQIVSTILMLIIGPIIIYRSLPHRATFIGLLIGVGFTIFGIYRMKFIIDYFKKRRP